MTLPSLQWECYPVLVIQVHLNIPFNILEDKPAIGPNLWLNSKHKPLFYKTVGLCYFKYQVLSAAIIMVCAKSRQIIGIN